MKKVWVRLFSNLEEANFVSFRISRCIAFDGFLNLLFHIFNLKFVMNYSLPQI